MRIPLANLLARNPLPKVGDLMTEVIRTSERVRELIDISQIDAIADCAEDVGVLLTIRPLTVPETMKPILELFVDRVLGTIREAAKLIDLIDDLVESGFSGPPAEQVLEQAAILNRAEHEADKIQDQCAKVLFKEEDAMPPAAVFMWTKVLNKIGDMANHAENVGDQFRLFVAG
jgi:predicted phosphate transport protein (TIGR00153 family)